MRRMLMGMAVAMAALVGVAHADDQKFTMGVSIPAADHGWTAGVVDGRNEKWRADCAALHCRKSPVT